MFIILCALYLQFCFIVFVILYVVYCFECVYVLFYVILCIVVPLQPSTYPLAVNNNNNIIYVIINAYA